MKKLYYIFTWFLPVFALAQPVLTGYRDSLQNYTDTCITETTVKHFSKMVPDTLYNYKNVCTGIFKKNCHIDSTIRSITQMPVYFDSAITTKTCYRYIDSIVIIPIYIDQRLTPYLNAHYMSDSAKIYIDFNVHKK